MSELFFGLFDDPALALKFSGDGDAGDTTPPDPGTDDGDTGQTGDDVNVTIQRIDLGRVYHVPHGTPYHRENSRQGIHYAHKHGFDSIDLDMQRGKQGTVFNTHWGTPLDKDGFVDPMHQIQRNARMVDLTDAQIMRLIAEGEYRIDTMATQFQLCASLGLKVRAEAKPNNAHYWTVGAFRALKATSDSVHCKTVIATLDTYPEWKQVLKNARAVGYDTRRLYG